MKKYYTIKLTDQQAWLAVHALENESYGDGAKFGEYSYARCAAGLKKKLEREGWKYYDN